MIDLSRLMNFATLFDEKAYIQCVVNELLNAARPINFQTGPVEIREKFAIRLETAIRGAMTDPKKLDNGGVYFNAVGDDIEFYWANRKIQARKWRWARNISDSVSIFHARATTGW